MTSKQARAPRIAMVGCGYWGKNLLRNFHELGVLHAVCDADQERAAAFAQQYGVGAAAFADVLVDPTVDGVVIATPAEQHAMHAREALLAGKHVFVEKPLALTVAEAQQLRALDVPPGRVLMVGHLLQYHPVFVRLKQMVAAGELGRLEYVYSNRLNLGKVRREENILWSFAPHDISMILALVGSLPEEVTAVGASYLHKTIADVTTTHLAFPGGENAHVYVSWLHPFKEQKLVVVGDAGMAVFNDCEPWSNKLVVYRHRIDWKDGIPVPNKADGQAIEVGQAEPLRAECEHFLACMEGRETCRTDAAEATRVLSVLEAAEQSMATRRTVALAPPRPAGIGEGVMVHESAYVDSPVEIGAGTRIWHFSHVLAGSRIGRDCTIGQNVVIGPKVSIGDRCKIQNNVSIYKGVTLEDGVFCGPSCVFTNVNTPRAEIERKNEFLETRVGRGATIGANATVVCGVSLGAWCFIAAGAVVTRDVPAYALMAGVPARRIGWVSETGERLGSDLICPRTGTAYRETGPERLEPANGGIAA
ncbi:MAG: Gfo/Idh/MocA family oxidoreductase [Gammaproteobacteria bacterium]|nr:Gfo/Idh/MocA family oxidoreductase [Gammaproteobacteria bacterium]